MIFTFARSETMRDFTYKHGIYQLPHELPNDLRSQEIRKYQESVWSSQNDRLVPSPPCKNRNLLIIAKNSEKQQLNLSRSVLSHAETRVSNISLKSKPIHKCINRKKIKKAVLMTASYFKIKAFPPLKKRLQFICAN